MLRRLRDLQSAPTQDTLTLLSAILDVLQVEPTWILDREYNWNSLGEQTLLNRAHALEQQIPSVPYLLVATRLKLLGGMQVRQGRYYDAERTLHRALALHEAHNDTRSWNYNEITFLLGVVYFKGIQYPMALLMLRRAHDAYLRAHALPLPAFATCLQCFGSLHLSQSRPNLAWPLLEKAAKAFEASLGKTHPITQRIGGTLVGVAVQRKLFKRQSA